MPRFLVTLVLVLGLIQPTAPARAEPATQSDCSPAGWFPSGFGLKDHHVFQYDGDFYLVSNYIEGENKFAYARSKDLCQWEELSPILSHTGAPGSGEEQSKWAPFVLQEAGTFYLYYTGVTSQFTQRMLLATTQNPADPASWQPQGQIFAPDHPSMVWNPAGWADCRDPSVLHIGELYYLYYTGRDNSGAIIGLAVAESPQGPWKDWGAILSAPYGFPYEDMYESPGVVQHQGYFYLYYNDTFHGPKVRVGPTPAGPWSKPQPLFPGWAHEIWFDTQGNSYASYLTGYTVTIRPLTWDPFSAPPMPVIGSSAHHLALPLIRRTPPDATTPGAP